MVVIGRFSAIKLLGEPQIFRHAKRASKHFARGHGKAFKDPGFAKEFKKLTGVDPSPITSEAIEAAIKDLPRDPETIALYKHSPTTAQCRRAIFLKNVL